MSAALAVVAPRLSRLIRMLASDRDMEALAACRAIGRTLASVNQDFHALASIIENNSTTVHHGSADMRAMAVWLIKTGARLTEKEQQFVCQMAGWRGDPSERQAAWLLAIFERVSSQRGRA